MNESTTSPATRLLIVGSCVSRDVVRIDDGATLDLVAYIARSSFASSMSPRPIDPGKVDVNKIASAFQKRMVELDLGKRLSQRLEDYDFDLLVVDLIDERFALLLDARGTPFTASKELLSTGARIPDAFARKVNSGSDEFFQLWTKGWDAFIDRLAALERLDRLRLNKVYWAPKTDEGAADFGGITPEQIENANDFLDRMYAHIERTLPKSHVLEFSRSDFVADANHHWGVTPFHYTEDYYREAARRLGEVAA